MENKALKNAKWIVGCKIIQSLINLIIGLITARYLGPTNYGVISYVASVVAFAVPIMQLGLKHTLVNEFIQTPENEGVILGTSLIMNVISSVCCMFGAIAFVAFVNVGEKDTVIVCILYSLSLLFQATEITQYWFQSKLLSKYSSVATLIAYCGVSAYKIYLLISQKNIYWFALSYVLECSIVSILLLISYKKVGGKKIEINWVLGKELLSRSKYYIIPSLMVMVFQHTDRIMLKVMVGGAETGYYSAAITCIGISSFVFAAIIDSARPIVLEARKHNQAKYEMLMIRLYSIITWVSLLQSIGMTVLSNTLVLLLYGSDYSPSAVILSVAVWYITFGYYGSVRNVWILAENKQKYLLVINLLGASANVVLNLVLIPVLYGVGAAVASIITQLLTNVVVGFMIKPIRQNNLLMIRGLNPIVMIDMIKEILDAKKQKKY